MDKLLVCKHKGKKKAKRASFFNQNDEKTPKKALPRLCESLKRKHVEIENLFTRTFIVVMRARAAGRTVIIKLE